MCICHVGEVAIICRLIFLIINIYICKHVDIFLATYLLKSGDFQGLKKKLDLFFPED